MLAIYLFLFVIKISTHQSILNKLITFHNLISKFLHIFSPLIFLNSFNILYSIFVKKDAVTHFIFIQY